MRRLKRTGVIALAAAIAVVAIGLAGRLIDETSLARRTDEQAIVAVSVIRPQRGIEQRDLVLPGDIQAWFEAPIYARVPGYLKHWYEDIGARVKSGQLLADIDTPDLDQQLHQAQADLSAAQAKERLANVTTKRWHALLSTNSVSQQDADEKAGNAEATQADVTAAQANVDRLQALESFKRIVAPFDGVVTARETDVGALINAGSAPGVELFRVADTHQMRVYVRVPQALGGDLRAGQEAELHLPQSPGESFPAKLLTTSHAINTNSRTLLVELVADNAEGRLEPGTYTEVHFKLAESPNVLRLPDNAFLFRQNGLEVATVGPDNKVVLKHVTIGRDTGVESEIASGLDPSDRVIDSPPDSLAGGDVVRPVEPSPAVAGAQASDSERAKQ